MKNKLKIIAIPIMIMLVMAIGILYYVKINEKTMNKLTEKQRSIVLISSYTMKGDIKNLDTELIYGLNHGLSINEIKEILLQMSAYAGFPRSLNAVTTFQKIIEKRESEGIFDAHGNTPNVLFKGIDKNKYGENVRSGLVGNSSQGTYANFIPVIDDFLKEHLFADIFGRGVLSNQERELATISALSSVPGLDAQLKGHLNIGINIGLTLEELQDVVSLVGVKSSADLLKNVLYSKTSESSTKVEKLSENKEKFYKEKVHFKNRVGIVVVGDLYIPKNIDKSKKYSAIIVGHTFTGVKEQTSGLHAQKLAELGFITLAFDASFWGESGGQLRNIEVPGIRVEDFSAGVDFLSNHPLVDANRIAALGICGGGGYVLSAAAIDHRIKAIATISMYDLGRARRQGLGDVISYEQRMETLDKIGELRTKEFRGEERTDTLGVPLTITEKDTENTREFYDYYRTPRGNHPNAGTSYSLISQAAMMNFFPFEQIETISPRPILLIVGERAVSKYFSDNAYFKASEPKEIFVVPNASHVDLYDRPEYLKITLPKLADFFTKNLDGKTPVPTSNTSKIKVMRKADFVKSEAPSDKFSGKVEVEYIQGIPESSNGLVSFSKGARTAWHSHPKGQMIIIVSGIGNVQQEGGEVIRVYPGDVVWFPAGVKHWHGAEQDSEMSHYAITPTRDGISATWMELVK